MAWEIVAYQDEQARQPVTDFIASCSIARSRYSL